MCAGLRKGSWEVGRVHDENGRESALMRLSVRGFN